MHLFVVAANAQDAWTRGNEEYAAGHFAEAVNAYQGLVTSGQTSAALFYNIANAEYRIGHLGQSILNYERALALDPHQPEAEANLRLVREKAHALELRRNAFAQFVARFTTAQYSIAAAIAFWIAAFAITAGLMSRRRSGGLIALSAVALLVFSGTVYALHSLETGVNGRSLAVVTAQKVEARLATADSAGTVLVLPAGSEVKVISTRGDWSYAALPNDLRGWIPANSAERVRL